MFNESTQAQTIHISCNTVLICRQIAGGVETAKFQK